MNTLKIPLLFDFFYDFSENKNMELDKERIDRLLTDTDDKDYSGLLEDD